MQLDNLDFSKINIQIAANAIKARVLEAPREVKLVISELLSFQNDTQSTFKKASWDGHSSFFDFSNSTFPAGFMFLVTRELRRLGANVSIIKRDLPQALGPEVGTHDYLGFGFSEKYDYQLEVTRRLLRHGRFIAQIATGGGKSNVAVISTGTIKRPTLFITTRSVLMYQMKKAYESAGMNPGVVGDNIWEPRKNLNVAMVQTIMAKLNNPVERDNMIKVLESVEFVIGEEAHEAGGNSYFEILNLCKNAHYRLALTATPFMRDDNEANMRLMAAFGPIGIKVSEKDLIDKGILATPSFKIIKNGDAVPNLRRGTKWPTCYELGIVNNKERNKIILYETLRAVNKKLPVLILVQRKDHGKILENALKKLNVAAKYIKGESDRETRQEALEDLASGKIQALIGSTIVDVGVDVPAVGLVILAGGGKAEVATRQRIGRGLRRKKSGPNVCFVVDFEDSFNTILMKHALTRREILEKTEGFAENILSETEDFNYKQFDETTKELDS